jgi:DNA-binding response OmpR family regulator
MDDGRGMTTAGTASDRKHILIVDDDPNELKMLRYYLKDHYKVAVISSGRTAMEFLSKYTPDLVLLDYLMPENNGAAVLKDMQSRDRTKDIPVFFLTGQTGTETIRECLTLRPAGYIVKPVARNALLAKMKEALG